MKAPASMLLVIRARGLSADKPEVGFRTGEGWRPFAAPALTFPAKSSTLQLRPRMRGAKIGNTPGEDHERSYNCYR